MHANPKASIPPSPKIPQGLKRVAYVHDRFEALGTNKRSRHENLCTTDTPSKDVSPLAQDTAPVSFRGQVGDNDLHHLPTLASHGATMRDINRPTPKREWPTALLPVERVRSAEQNVVVVGSKISDSTFTEAESQAGSSCQDEDEPLDLLASETSKISPLIDLSFKPSTAEEATAGARSASPVWNLIQRYLRDLVRFLPQASSGSPHFTLRYLSELEVLAFNQILMLPYQRSVAGEWWRFLETQFGASQRRHYHLAMGILTYVVGEKNTCTRCYETTRCPNCHEDDLPGCYIVPEHLMPRELMQAIGCACANCILRKKQDQCRTKHDFHLNCTTTNGPQESEESQRSASVPDSSDHTLPDEGSVPPAPSTSWTNNEISPPADTHVLLPSPGENVAISQRLFGEVCEVANLFATFRTVGDQQEFINSMVEPLTTPGVNSVVMDAIAPTLDLSQSEREKVVAVFQELLPMTPTKTHLLRLIALVYEQPAELQESLVRVVMNSLSLRTDFHVGVQKAHKTMLLPEGDRKGFLSILLAFRTGDSKEKAVPH